MTVQANLFRDFKESIENTFGLEIIQGTVAKFLADRNRNRF